MDNKLLYYIWLSNCLKPGSSIPKLLLSHFESIDEIYNASKDDYKLLGISVQDINCLCNKDLDKARGFLKFCTDERVGILTYEDPYYPERLKLIDNPPPMFYYRGRLNLLDDYPCITMVGTRSCSERGFRLAYETAFDAASKGAVIVNGLALGIDGACIAAALDANGYAVGILGCGIDRIYPSANKDLFHRLSASGLILSEFAPFSEPAGYNFPVRNRVLSGLSVATVVFEAEAEKSGAMITARHALNQGRRIFAVPAKPYDKSYSGALELIKDGASVFTEADDVLAEYSLNFPHRINLANKNPVPKDKLDRYVARYFKKNTDPDTPVNRRFVPQSKQRSVEKEEKKKQPLNTLQTSNVKATKTEVKTHNNIDTTSALPATTTDKDLSVLSVSERKIYELFTKNSSLTADDIAGMGIDVADILSTLTLLEIYGLIKPLPGGRYQINN